MLRTLRVLCQNVLLHVFGNTFGVGISLRNPGSIMDMFGLILKNYPPVPVHNSPWKGHVLAFITTVNSASLKMYPLVMTNIAMV